jgi:hypothetical protein
LVNPMVDLFEGGKEELRAQTAGIEFTAIE